jgi:predicted DNA-binding protein with PD1-like motif
VASGIHRSETCRHLVIRLAAGEFIPDAIVAVLKDEQVSCGWLRGSGVLADVELRAYDPTMGTLGSARHIEGPLQALALEGSIGLVDGDPSVSLRALLVRETDRGLESLAGEIGSARTLALEALVTSLDDVSLQRTLDEGAGVWLLGGGSGPTAMRPAPARTAIPAAWSSAVEASDRHDREPRARLNQGTGASTGTAVPTRPQRPSADLDAPFPEPGDAVDHFAFGRCDVMKSDGDRLHLKVHKDGRIREIALGMLRVSCLDGKEDGKRHFKLERRM